jgi:hypothetical protein
MEMFGRFYCLRDPHLCYGVELHELEAVDGAWKLLEQRGTRAGPRHEGDDKNNEI